MFNWSLLSSAVLLVVIDSIYLNLIQGYFGWQIRTIQKSPLRIRLLGAVLCYIFLIVGINYFIIQQKKTIYDAFLLGLVIYGVFETTNYALFDKWNIITVFIDTLWGGVLFAITTYIIQSFREYKFL